MIRFLVLVLLCTGCFSLKRKTISSETTPHRQEVTVSDTKEQKMLSYDELLKKYQELEKKYQALKHEGRTNSSSLVETVDLGDNKKEVEDPKVSKGLSEVDKEEYNIEMASEMLMTAIDFMEKGRFGESMGLLKQLENSSIMQIAVRAKYYEGEILFKQKEYDLAMQIYESIMNEMAYSGFAFKSLERLIICAQELGLKAKHQRYLSLKAQFSGDGGV